MTLDEQLKFCRACINRKFDMNVGVVCGLTNAKPNFSDWCSTFVIDEPEAKRLAEIERQAVESETSGNNSSLEGKGIKMGVLGGIIMMVVAGVWFFAGLAANRIFFYPPILFVIGIYALIKGLASGNIAGEKKN
jgi:hypothetical protein